MDKLKRLFSRSKSVSSADQDAPPLSAPKKALPVGLEKRLNHLEAVSGLRKEGKPSSSKISLPKVSFRKTYWSKGTGYGHSSCDYSWDVASYSAASKDLPVKETCEALCEDIERGLKGSSPESVCKAIENSCLTRFLAQQLKNDSLVDMERHRELLDVVFKLCGILVSHPSSVRLFLVPLNAASKEKNKKATEQKEPAASTKSLYTIICDLKSQAETIDRRQRACVERLKREAEAAAKAAVEAEERARMAALARQEAERQSKLLLEEKQKADAVAELQNLPVVIPGVIPEAPPLPLPAVSFQPDPSKTAHENLLFEIQLGKKLKKTSDSKKQAQSQQQQLQQLNVSAVAPVVSNAVLAKPIWKKKTLKIAPSPSVKSAVPKLAIDDLESNVEDFIGMVLRITSLVHKAVEELQQRSRSAITPRRHSDSDSARHLQARINRSQSQGEVIMSDIAVELTSLQLHSIASTPPASPSPSASMFSSSAASECQVGLLVQDNGQVLVSVNVLPVPITNSPASSMPSTPKVPASSESAFLAVPSAIPSIPVAPPVLQESTDLTASPSLPLPIATTGAEFNPVDTAAAAPSPIDILAQVNALLSADSSIPPPPPVPAGPLPTLGSGMIIGGVPAAAVKKKVEYTAEQLAQMEVEKKERYTISYEKSMLPLRFSEVNSFVMHHYTKHNDTNPITRQFIRRVASEFSDLSRSLPLSSDSSVFMRVHEENTQLCQMLITAPFGTPYGGGCFIFDLFLPGMYPNVPPLCNLQTTGRGCVRFNPNLYNCGKVCLSLLGTWSGSSGETWMPGVSTLLQLAVSIQSLIFVPQPYFNEPGYESSIGSSQGESDSDQYNVVIERGAINHAMLDMLRQPPHGFEQVVKRHFYLHQDKILQQCEGWLKLKGRDAWLPSMLDELREEFAKLKKTDCMQDL